MKKLTTLVAVLAIAAFSATTFAGETDTTAAATDTTAPATATSFDGTLRSVDAKTRVFVVNQASTTAGTSGTDRSFLYNDATKFSWNVIPGTTQPDHTARSTDLVAGARVRVSYGTDVKMGSTLATGVAITPPASTP